MTERYSVTGKPGEFERRDIRKTSEGGVYGPSEGDYRLDLPPSPGEGSTQSPDDTLEGYFDTDLLNEV